MATNKRKTTTAVVASVAAVALLLGGTFAWTSISQQAKNESAGIVNVGGRLHDDFNGTNKDVYVENFTDPINGGQPIYARVKLTEYMEVGQDAGGTDDGDNVHEAVPVVDGTDINDKDNWSVHIPAEYCYTCNTGDTCLIHDHWKWEMGGSTTFMPTFNKDKDSLAADINGTYHGTDDSDKIYYDDYVVYTTDGATGGNDIAEADKEAYEGQIYSIVGTEYYDDDTDTEDNGGTRQVDDVTHTAKQTATATVITMEEWMDPDGAYQGQPGNYWVYDEDGWAYWANPIMPGEATGLLLSKIEMEKNPGEKCYYAINVVGQFATVGEWEYFYNENDEFDGTQNALALLTTASQNVPTVGITGEIYLTVGETYTFTATASRGEQSAAAEGDFEWSVVYENGAPVDDTAVMITETADGAEITVSGDAVPDGTTLMITARSTDENYLGATGVKAIAVKNPNALVPEVAVTLNDSEVANISDIMLTAEVMHNLAAYENAPIEWSIADESGNPVSETVATVEGDKLRIVQTEGTVTLVVKATCTLSGNTTTETMTVTFNASEFCDTCGTKYTDNGFCPSDACTTGQYEPAALSGDVYQITNGGQLFWLAEQVNASGTAYNATLTNDIDLEDKAWTPIGLNDQLSYSGTFDGAGHSITGLSITASDGQRGLFGRVKNATIKDFSVSGEMTITGVTAAETQGYATIASVFGEATISGIHSELNITVTDDNGNNKLSYIGGILGYLNRYSTSVTVENCSYTGTIEGAAGPAYDCIGGIVAYFYAEQKATVNNCLFAGEIDVVTDTGTGGILGYYRGGKLELRNCLSYGMIYKQVGDGQSLSQTGAIAGIIRKFYENSIDTNTVENNYYCYKNGSIEGYDAYGEVTPADARDRVDNEAESAPVTETEIADGTVCGKLNGESGTIWTQVGTYPVPNNLTNN